MRDVLFATLPGIIILTWFFGPGTLINVLLGALIALITEYAVTALRGQNPRIAVSDLSILVTSTLLCIALPPYAPWWLIVLGVVIAVLLGKHVFGGLGYNPFNPAMVGYVVLLISFPCADEQLGNPEGTRRSPRFAGHSKPSFSPRYH
jgi:electron transport complex protein RnfD